MTYLSYHLILVPRAGLEPAHREILVFETNASTNSAIGARMFVPCFGIADAKV